jgi:hypothetical protein
VSTEAESKFLDRNWSGGNKTVNAYPQGLAFHNGRLHLTWCWRDTPVASTCHDLCYAYSDDVGRTWFNNEGQAIAETGVSFLDRRAKSSSCPTKVCGGHLRAILGRWIKLPLANHTYLKTAGWPSIRGVLLRMAGCR